MKIRVRKKHKNKKNLKDNAIGYEYYQPVFAKIHVEYGSDIQKALIEEPLTMQKEFWESKLKGKKLSGEAAWEKLYDYLKIIESKMQAIIVKHSIYYWIHLYRRIGVELSTGHQGKVDNHTLGLVRNIMELAFIRYGAIDTIEDMKLSSVVKDDEILGGLLKQLFTDSIEDKSIGATYIKILKESSQWVMTEFSVESILNIYRLEGLAYEYWRTTAFLRGVGKGAKIYLSADGLLYQIVNKELGKLLDLYDERIGKHDFNTTSLGVGFYSPHKVSDLSLLIPQYNVEGKMMSEVSPPKFMADLGDFRPNFVWGAFNLDEYLSAHDFLSAEFKKKKGFSLELLCIYLRTLSYGLTASDMCEAKPSAIGNLYKRAYKIGDYTPTGLSTNVAESIGTYFESYSFTEKEIELIGDYLTLTEEKQKQVCLWSGGPQFIFIPYFTYTLVDLRPIPSILYTLFFKARAVQTDKGKVFEDNFRDLIKRNKLDLLTERNLKNHAGAKEEIDAGVRIGDILFICECRAHERPLNYEIGNIKTFEERKKDIEGKIAQVKRKVEFIKTYPRGSNYDLSWAKEIKAIVVSPFVEWIWSTSKELWVDKNNPMILEANEAIELMKSQI